MPGHRLLAACSADEQRAGLARLLATMDDQVYGSGGRTGVGEDWLSSHLGRKVYARIDSARAHPPLAALVGSGEVVIDGRVHPALGTLLARVSSPDALRKLAPQRVCTVHGDLTLENVLYATDDVRLIDMDGADYVDAPELDMGKLFQSIVGRYESWAHSEHKLFESVRGVELETVRRADPAEPALEGALLDGLGADPRRRPRRGARQAGAVPHGPHLVRMVPFRVKVPRSRRCRAHPGDRGDLEALA
jgi:hypothetical protein